jgi:glycosyltransferase involved in cell wall biosynthesis
VLAAQMIQRIGVVLTTYNRPDALRLVLASLDAQIYRDFEVVVADDGSGAETGAVIEEVGRRASFPLRHVWQEDRGFRAAAIRNRAVAALATDYLVFLDGDGVVRPDFLASHARLAEPGFYVRGNSLYLSPSLTATVLRDGLPIYRWGLLRWIRYRRDVIRLRPLLRLPLGVLRKCRPRTWRGSKTCNLGIWRSDFLAVNGLDEAYEGWGFEDSDLAIRLIKHGVFHKDGRCSLPVIHLWHEQRDQESAEANRRLLALAQESEATRAEKGVSQYL